MTHDRERRGPRADGRQEPRILSLSAGRASTLRSEVESLVATRRKAVGPQAEPVRVTIDVPPEAPPVLDASLGDAMARLVAAAFATAVNPDPASDAPHVAEVVITGVFTSGGLEIEIASSGCPAADADAEVAATRAVVERSGGTLVVGPCPEGGRAMTLRLPRRAARRQAA